MGRINPVTKRRSIVETRKWPRALLQEVRLRFPCGYCDARPGQPCRARASGREASETHQIRKEAASVGIVAKLDEGKDPKTAGMKTLREMMEEKKEQRRLERDRKLAARMLLGPTVAQKRALLKAKVATGWLSLNDSLWSKRQRTQTYPDPVARFTPVIKGREVLDQPLVVVSKRHSPFEPNPGGFLMGCEDEYEEAVSAWKAETKSVEEFPWRWRIQTGWWEGRETHGFCKTPEEAQAAADEWLRNQEWVLE